MIVILWIAFGVITGVIASNKGRSTGSWFLYGLVLGPIALVHALVTHSNAGRLENDAIATGVMRKCPYCAEIVKAEAIVCRFCQRDLPQIERRVTVSEMPPSVLPAEMYASPGGLQRSTKIAIVIGLVLAALMALSVQLPVFSSQPAILGDSSTFSAGQRFTLCVDRGIAHYEAIGSFPTLSDGRKATDAAREQCAKTTGAF